MNSWTLRVFEVDLLSDGTVRLTSRAMRTGCWRINLTQEGIRYGWLLDRLTHHVHILTMNGDSYRLKQSAARRAAVPSNAAEQNQATA